MLKQLPPPSTETTDGARRFINDTMATQIVPREVGGAIIRALPPNADSRLAAEAMISEGHLTRYQAETILNGRSDQLQFGRYLMLDEIGRGGMGRVYRALHQTMGRTVAVKLLASDSAPTDRARRLFENEVRSAAKLNHPNIVSVFDGGHQHGRSFLVMEYIDGPSLQQYVAESGPLSVRESQLIVSQMAAGLDAAHSAGLVHRDIKPANVLLCQKNGKTTAKILDFGLVKSPADPHRAADTLGGEEHTILGTPDFMAPEQAQDHRKADQQSDLYALGCTFYFLLTGTVPFPGGTTLEKLIRHSTEPLPDVRSIRPDVPDPIAELIRRLTAKKPADRPSTAKEVLTELTGPSDGPSRCGLTDTVCMPVSVTSADIWGEITQDTHDSLVDGATAPGLSRRLRTGDRTASRSFSGQLTENRKDTAWGILLFAVVMATTTLMVWAIQWLLARSAG